MQKEKIIKILSIITLLTIPVTVFSQSQPVDPLFTPNKLIDDKIFVDTQTFGGAAGVQKFLEAKGSVLASTNSDFLIKLKEPVATILKQGLEDPQPSLGRLRTAAELIWDASQFAGINPQVILVTLNKEQSLITGQFTDDAKLQKALDRSMGFACPDSGGCGDLFPGFYYQLFGNFDSAGNRYIGAAKSLARSFNTEGGRGPAVSGRVSRIGDTITLDNTLGGYDGILPQQTVQLSNSATAALYRYTPHVFNGNYNFWRFFQAWFRYPNGTLLKLAQAGDTYIIQNGLKQMVPAFVAQARGLNLTTAIIVSPNEFESYQTDAILSPADNTIIAVAGDSQKYVFINNIKHPASDFVIKQRGLNPASVLAVTPSEGSLFNSGSILTPSDGTIIRGQTNQAVYLVKNGSLQMFSAFTFGQRKIPAKQVVTVPDAEISTYPKFGFVAPLENTIFKSPASQTVYIAGADGLKHPMTAEIFKNRKVTAKQVVQLTAEEVDAMAGGTLATPKDPSYFAVAESGQIYIFKEGSKHPVSSFVSKQRGITADFKVSQYTAYEWPDGIAIPPRDNTIVKGDIDATVYLVAKGQLRPMTYQAYLNRKITPKKISVLPQYEVDAYAKGETLTK